MQFQPDEKIVLEAPGFPMLTTHRLWHSSDSGSQKKLKAILLEDLCYCSIAHHEMILWLVLAILAALLGVLLAMADRQQALPILLAFGVMALVFWLLYGSSKRQQLTLSAASGDISLWIEGDRFDDATAFVEAVLSAKNERYLVGKRSQPGLLRPLPNLESRCSDPVDATHPENPRMGVRVVRH